MPAVPAVVVAVALSIAVQGPAVEHARVASGCESYPSDQARLALYADLFFDGSSRRQEERAGLGISQVQPGAVQEVVSDDTLCDQVIAIALDVLNGSRGALTEANTEFAIFRHGPYLLVADRPAGEYSWRAGKLIFREASLEYLVRMYEL